MNTQYCVKLTDGSYVGEKKGEVVLHLSDARTYANPTMAMKLSDSMSLDPCYSSAHVVYRKIEKGDLPNSYTVTEAMFSSPKEPPSWSSLAL